MWCSKILVTAQVFLLDTEMVVARRGQTDLKATVCCPRLRGPREKGCWVLKHNQPLPPTVLSSGWRNASEKHGCGHAPLELSTNQEKAFAFSELSVFGLFAGTSVLVTLLKGTLLPIQGLPWAVSGIFQCCLG